MSGNWFLHVDLDAFFASVEQLDNPKYRGKPVIVGGQPGDRRSVVSTCSYEARKFGVHSAMPISKAYELCPNGIYLPGRMKRYHDKSVEVMSVLKNYSPDVQQMSIDEAFIDLTGTERLFGPAEQTAQKLKKEVLEKTHLTISVGMATNKYLAKIASGISKPDGFYKIEQGDEEKFMLSLPLKDVWGLGTKTLQKLNNAGIRTTQQLHNCSLELLTTMFGSCSALFLYNSVRGIAEKKFDNVVKNKSISAEHTFEFDVTDFYTIDTALLHLSTEIFFRLLDENVNSKTVCLKIRYEDFTTVTIQDTSSSLLSTSDDLYLRAKNLFNKKYISGNGIRLLGVGVQNVESGNSEQGELFDFGNKKKSDVEKAILKIQKKDPNSKIKKARLMLKAILLLLLTFTTYNSYADDTLNEVKTEITTDENTTEVKTEIATDENTTEVKTEIATDVVKTDANKTTENKTEDKKIVFDLPLLPSIMPESPKSLFQYQKNNTNVEFITEGWWQSKIGSGLTFQKQNDLSSFSVDGFVFEQKVDLSMWFLLNKKWYFEAIFKDGFEKNTIAAGYYGKGIIKHIRLGNNGISFPEIYNISSIGGGNIQSPGFMASLSGKNWRTDAIVRIDNLRSNEKTFTGQNEITEKQIALSSWENGRRFILPNISASDILSVYVQSEDGTFFDTSGRKYKKLSDSEYAFKPLQNLLFLSKTYSGAIAITFTDINTKNNFKNNLGNFDNEGTFLNDCKKTFAKNSSIKIQDYTYAKNNCDGFFTEISDGVILAQQAAIIQNPPYFSPFIISDYYKVGTNEFTDASIISKSAKNTFSDFTVVLTKDEASFTQTDYVKSVSTYAKVFYSNNSSDSTYLKADNRYPFAAIVPQIYLQNISDFTTQSTDAVLSLNSYTKTSSYNIGTSALSGTVRVYVNGIIDESALYNTKTGKIEFVKKPTEFDRIRITWQEYDKLSQSSAITAALGYKYNFNKFASFYALTSSIWNLNFYKNFSKSNESLPGSANIQAKYEYKTPDFLFSNNTEFGIYIDDITNYKQIFSMDENKSDTIYLGSDCSQSIINNFVPQLNLDTAPTLTLNKKQNFDSLSTIKDSGITGLAIQTEWSFCEQDNWAAYEINLGNSSTALASAQIFNIAFKNNQNFTEEEIDFDIYLQLGINFEKENYWENSDSISTWLISKKKSQDSDYENVLSSFILSNNTDWQTVSIKLTDIDRSKLSVNSDARIIIVCNNTSGVSITKGIKSGPYEIVNSFFDISTDSNVVINSQTLICTDSPLQNTFNKEKTNYMENIVYNISEDATLSETSNAIISKYFSEIDSSLYYYFNTQVKFGSYESVEKSPTLKITLERPISTTEFETTLSFTIDSQTVFDCSQQDKWHTIEVNLSQKEIFLNNKLDNNSLVYDSSISPTHLKIELQFSNTDEVNEISFDNIYLSKSHMDYYVKNKTELQYKKKGSLLKKGNQKLLTDFNFSTDVTEKYSINENNFTIDGKTSAGVSIFGISLNTDLKLNSDNANIISAAGHKISTTKTNSFFNNFQYSQQYNLNMTDNIAEKTDSLLLKIPLNRLPISIKTVSTGSTVNNNLTQKNTSELTLTIPGKKCSYNIVTKLTANQIDNNNFTYITDEENYFNTLKDLTYLQFSNGTTNANQRSQILNIVQKINIPALNFIPQVTIEGSNNFLNSSLLQANQKTTFELLLPFKINKKEFSFSWKKIASENFINYNSKTHTADAEFYFNNLYEKKWLLQTLPFADLFSEKLTDTIASQTFTNDSLAYSTTYTLSWKRPKTNNAYKDVFLPSSFKFITARDITNNASGNLIDIVQYKATLGYTALNSFGRLGNKKKFTWYDQDELSQSYSISLKFTDAYSKLESYLISGYSVITLYFTKTNSLSNTTEFQFTDSDKWNVKSAFTWKRPINKSPTTNIIFKIIPSLKKEKISLIRKNSFYYQIANIDEITNSAKISHQLETKFGKYVTITGDAAVIGIYKTSNALSIQCTATLTGKVSF